jgi:hypothetical protein
MMKFRILLLILAMTASVVHAADDSVIAVGRFAAMTPGAAVTGGWEPLTFKKIKAHTRYTLVEDAGHTVLRADSNASASGLVKKMSVDPKAYPVISWSWKVSNTLAKGDVSKKSGDDYAARIYITFAENPQRLSFFQRTELAAIRLLYGETPPTAALTYVWGNHAAIGSIHPNPYTDRVQMIIVDSGPAHLNQWRSVRRNIVKDFQQAFGTPPPHISGIAVMTDTDNTGESATAWYGDITLHHE